MNNYLIPPIIAISSLTLSFSQPAQLDIIEKKVVPINYVAGSFISNNLYNLNVTLVNSYDIRSLEDIFGKMSSYTKEENEHFWSDLKSQCTTLKGIIVT